MGKKTVEDRQKEVDMVDKEAGLKRIAEANSEARRAVVSAARGKQLSISGQYMRGLLTPLDYVNDVLDVWMAAHAELESLEAGDEA